MPSVCCQITVLHTDATSARAPVDIPLAEGGSQQREKVSRGGSLKIHIVIASKVRLPFLIFTVSSSMLTYFDILKIDF